MKSITEAFNVLLEELEIYLGSCKENGQIRNDTYTYILNHNPLRLLPFFSEKRFSGETGYKKGLKFKKEIIQQKTIQDTPQLISHLINHAEQENGNFSAHLWAATREMAGFTIIHINHLAKKHSDLYLMRGIDKNFGLDTPQVSDESKEIAMNLINQAIAGKYYKALVECLNDIELSQDSLNAIVRSPHAFCYYQDYGELLLNSLNKELVKPNQLQLVEPDEKNIKLN